MSIAHEIKITLPADMAEQVERKVRSGAYASASEVVHDGIKALLERDAALDEWLKTEVVAGHQEYLEQPSRATSAETVVDRIKARRQATSAQ